MNIKQVTTDWFFTNEAGEEYTTYEVGKNNVTKIEEHRPQGEGDRWCCLVLFEDKTAIRVFNLNSISFEDVE